jgi:hypothetical protein
LKDSPESPEIEDEITHAQFDSAAAEITLNSDNQLEKKERRSEPVDLIEKYYKEIIN